MRSDAEAHGSRQAELQPTSAHPGTYLARLVEGEATVHVPDPEDVIHTVQPQARALAETGSARTLLLIALRTDQALLGSMWLYRREAEPFSAKQIALLRNFAAHAVIAMENARLLGELRQRTDDMAELNRNLEARVAEQVEELGRSGD
jgi:GAF domain-containing protein